jgi:DGQHR domain-containing protein
MAKPLSPTKKLRKRKKKKVLSVQEKLVVKRKKKLHSNVMKIFKQMGFEYVRTSDIHKEFGGIRGELDSTFLFENLILICEETISDSDKNHLRKKDDYFGQIKNNKKDFVDWLKGIDADKFSKFDKYSLSRYKIFYIYITDNYVSDEIKSQFNNFKFMGVSDLKYFVRITSCLRFTARNELYKYLGLDLDDISHASSTGVEKYIDSAVILPESSSGFPEGIQLVSFVMRAKDLMDCAYVFRKDNWENKITYYQRLIEQKKIDNIRKFLASKKRTFIDNIIVSLPNNVKFQKIQDEKDVDILELDIIENIKIKIPYKINSIGVIDGQHRIYGHYEGSDPLEKEIRLLRDKRHLLVTGLYYNKRKFKEIDKRKFESELFLQINNEQKKVGKSILQYIKSLQDPYSSIGIATNVLTSLNRRDTFLNLFILSPLDTKGIKTPTIIQYGLQDLVEISDGKETLFKYWTHPKKNLLLNNKSADIDELYEEYIVFCTSSISIFFNAIKSKFRLFWVLDSKSKLLTVTSIVAFLHSFRKTLEKYKAVKDFAFYQTKLNHLDIDFSKGKFKYVSSQWPKLVDEIMSCFK